MNHVIRRIAIILTALLVLTGCAESTGRDNAAELGGSALSWDGVDEYLTAFNRKQADPEVLDAALVRLAVGQWAQLEAQNRALAEQGVTPSEAALLEAEQELQLAMAPGQDGTGASLGPVAPPDEIYDHMVNFAWQSIDPDAISALDDEAVLTRVAEILADELVVNSRVGEFNPQAGLILPAG